MGGQDACRASGTRKRYPDWRFRPGVNTFAKLNVKDGPQPANRKRGGQGGRKVKGDLASRKAKIGGERCAIIADLLVEGKTGVGLEDTVKRCEDGAGRGTVGRNDACSDRTVFGTKNEDGDGYREDGGGLCRHSLQCHFHLGRPRSRPTAALARTRQTGVVIILQLSHVPDSQRRTGRPFPDSAHGDVQTLAVCTSKPSIADSNS